LKQKIDFVVSWVNSDDQKWQKRMNEALKQQNLPTIMFGDERYYDYGFFKYLFRSIENFAPWVNHVYIVTDQQVPSFFTPNDKITIVDHTRFIPKKYLPTFNSNVIDFYLDKIPNLQENFVYFNDDMLLNKDVSPSDFFTSEGLPLDLAVPSQLEPRSQFEKIAFNNSIILNRYFPKKKVIKENWSKFFCLRYGVSNLIKLLLTLPFPYWSCFSMQHGPVSLRKSDFALLRRYADKEIKRTSEMQFRSDIDISIWLLQELRFMKGVFSPRPANDSAFFDFDSAQNLIKNIQTSSPKMICINDDSVNLSIDDKISISKQIIKALDKKFPRKSSVE
jgi:hypothetical protein